MKNLVKGCLFGLAALLLSHVAIAKPNADAQKCGTRCDLLCKSAARSESCKTPRSCDASCMTHVNKCVGEAPGCADSDSICIGNCYVSFRLPRDYFGNGPANCTDKKCWQAAVNASVAACRASGCKVCSESRNANEKCKYENGYTCTSTCGDQ